MRMLLALVLVAGCASTWVSDAVERAQTCEATYPGRCGEYWAEVHARQDAVDRQRSEEVERARSRPSKRHAIGHAISSVGGAYTAAGDTPPPPPTYRCTTDYIGGTICRPQ